MEPIEAAKSEAAKQAVILLFAVVTMVSVMVITQPDSFRTLKMRLAAGSSRLLSFLSRRAGHTSMGIELATGQQQYTLPYALSRLRDMTILMYNKETEGGCDAC